MKPQHLWNILLLIAVLASIKGIQEQFLFLSAPLPEDTSTPLYHIYSNRRSCSFFGWPTAFAGFLTLFYPYSVIAFCRRKTVKNFILFAILTLGFLSSKSVLPFVSVMVALIIANPRHFWPLLSFGLLAFTKNLTAFFDTRFLYHKIAWDMIQIRPFAGWGWGSFCLPYYNATKYVHNSYLQMWVETGIFGFLLVVGFALWVFNLKPTKNALSVGLYAGLLAFLIDNVVNFTAYRVDVVVFFFMTLTLYLYQRRQNETHLRH